MTRENDKHFDKMDQHISDIKDWLEMVVGRFQTRSGRKREDVAAGTLRLLLKRDDNLFLPDTTPFP